MFISFSAVVKFQTNNPSLCTTPNKHRMWLSVLIFSLCLCSLIVSSAPIEEANLLSTQLDFESIRSKPELIGTLLSHLIQHSPAPIPLVTQVLSVAKEINLPAFDLGFHLFQNVTLIKQLVEPQYAEYISDFYPLIPLRSELLSAIREDSEFRLNLSSDHSSVLRSRFITNWHDSLFALNIPASEIVALFQTFGIQIGNFDIKPSDLLVRPLRIVNSKWTPLHAAFTQESFVDSILVMFAMAIHRSSAFSNTEELGIFRLWQERNRANFEQLAPSEVVNLLK